MDTLNLFIVLIIPIGLGFILVQILLRSISLPLFFRLALGFGIGTGFVAQNMFLIGILGIPYSRVSITIPLVVVIAILWVYYKKNPQSKHQKIELYRPEKSFDLLSLCLKAYLVLIFIYIFWSSYNVPLLSWDAFATIAFKAKIIFYDHSLVNFERFPHNNYPLLVPLLQSWVAFHMQYWDDQWIKIFAPFYALTFAVIFYYVLRFFTNRRLAILGCALLFSASLVRMSATITYRDFPLMFYNCIAIFLLLLWNKTKENNLLLLSGLFVGFAAFTKVEGEVYMAMSSLLFFWLLYQKTPKPSFLFRRFCYFSVPALMVWSCFFLFRLSHHMSLEKKFHLFIDNQIFHRFISLLQKLNYEFFTSINWNMLWAFFTIFIILNRKQEKRTEKTLLLIAIFLYMVCIAVVSTFTGSYIYLAGEEWKTTLPRMLLHFFPLILFFSILVVFDEFNPSDEKNST